MNGGRLGAGSHVEEQGVARVDQLAEAFEKATMGVDFSIVALLHGEDEVDAPAVGGARTDLEIPGASHE